MVRREQHLKRFFEFIPKPSETYQKSANAGKKSSRDTSLKRRYIEPEPELFVSKYQEFCTKYLMMILKTIGR